MICKRNESSAFCPADDRRGRQRAAALLILLEQIELLRRFYGQVLMPEPVATELSAAGAPDVVREWITKLPTWVDVRAVTPDAVAMITDDLDLGERAAIALAETMHADLLL